MANVFGETVITLSGDYYGSRTYVELKKSSSGGMLLMFTTEHKNNSPTSYSVEITSRAILDKFVASLYDVANTTTLLSHKMYYIQAEFMDEGNLIEKFEPFFLQARDANDAKRIVRRSYTLYPAYKKYALYIEATEATPEFLQSLGEAHDTEEAAHDQE